MEVAVTAARWVVSKALAPVTDGLLEAWAASAGLGPNIHALKMELLYARGMLENAPSRDIRSVALKELLHTLRQLAYRADDALDELDYFRIQDALDGTYHAADVDDRGCLQDRVLIARHTVRDVAGKIKSICCSCATTDDREVQEDDGRRGCLSGICSCGGCMPKVTSGVRNAAHAVGKHFSCYSSPSVHDDAHTGMPSNARRFLRCAWPSKARQTISTVQTPTLYFHRVEMSKKIMDIIEQLKPVCAKVSTILNLELLGSIRVPTRNIAMDRPKTTPQIIEPKLYGRDDLKKSIIDDITHGQYFSKELTVLPIVGPGGIGKTTFTQHIYEEVKSTFQVPIWICVSLNFTADRLAQEILEHIPQDTSESKNASKEELIEQRLRSKRFLLVLDDVWTYHDDEWKKLLAPFKKVGTKGNFVIVTTRIPVVANMVSTIDSPIEMGRLSPEDIMFFFEACVFGDEPSWKEHPALCDVGSQIVEKLKGFPLAAKTVGRLLRNQLTLDHWTRVLESKEWESQASDNDIMPALKLSYDYLPFHLQQCFSYCALFREDYEFQQEELVCLWIGLGILHSDEQTKRIEDVGLCYLTDLVNQGFLKKNLSTFGRPNYVIHDLLHELVMKVSSYECLRISSSNVMSIQIPPSVRHLSIIIDDADVKDTMTFENYKRDLCALEKRFEVRNLHTLMLFGKYHGNFARAFRDLFWEARALRTVFLSEASYNVEDVLPNFSKLVHLRYLRITSVSVDFWVSHGDKGLCMPSVLSRFYHLEVINLQGWKGCFGSTRHMSNLVKLRHFFVPREELHSDIFEVGKLKFINNLKAFRVGQESKGFELSQLGKLTHIGGFLSIYSLEKVQSEEEATESKLIHKRHIQGLTLEWDVHRPNRDPKFEENVLQSLVPHSNLQYLRIRGHGGTNCPRWLGANLSVKNLESLDLDDLSWGNLPPLGNMWMVNDLGKEYQDCILGQRFQNLKNLRLIRIPRLRKWVNNTSHWFPHLEELIIEDCSALTELRFSHPQQEKSMPWFPRLKSLSIENCPELLSLPPIPWTHDPCSALIERVGSGLDQLICNQWSDQLDSKFSLRVRGKDGQDSEFLNGLVFSNLTYLKVFVMKNCSPLLLDRLLMLKFLEQLDICDSTSNVLFPIGSVSHVRCLLPVKRMSVNGCRCSGKELTQLFSLMPELTELAIECCPGINWLGVASSSAERLHHGKIGRQQQVVKIAARGDGVLLLPPKLQVLKLKECLELSLLPDSPEGDHEGGGLQCLRFLRSLEIWACPMFFSSYSSSPSSSFPFPTSLQVLNLQACGESGGHSIRPLLAQGHLRQLVVLKTPNFFAGSGPHDKELLPCSSELELHTDDVAGLLAAHTCNLLSSSLTALHLDCNQDADRFTHEQEAALQLLTSLQEIKFFSFEKLQCLPAGLHRLASLKKLLISSCQAIQSLPEDGLPSSLQLLYIYGCPAFESLPKDGLPSSLQQLLIGDCAVLKSLDGPPSSLQELNIGDCPALELLPKDGLLSYLQKLEIWTCPAIESLLKGSLPSSLQVLSISGCPALMSLPKGGLPSSLQKLRICDCPALKSLPKGSLPSSLQVLSIYECPALMSLPKGGLPSSLQKLTICDCPALKSLPEDSLPRSLQELEITGCTALNSLPKASLPRSLQVIDVSCSDNEELKRHCRKLRGTIPRIITAYPD